MYGEHSLINLASFSRDQFPIGIKKSNCIGVFFLTITSNLRSGPIWQLPYILLRGRAKIELDTKSLTPLLLPPDFGCKADWS